MRWFGTKSVALLLGVHQRTVERWCSQGHIRFLIDRKKNVKGNQTVTYYKIPETAIVEFLELYWAPDEHKYPNAKALTLDHFLEYGIKTGIIKNMRYKKTEATFDVKNIKKLAHMKPSKATRKKNSESAKRMWARRSEEERDAIISKMWEANSKLGGWKEKSTNASDPENNGNSGNAVNADDTGNSGDYSGRSG